MFSSVLLSLSAQLGSDWSGRMRAPLLSCLALWHVLLLLLACPQLVSPRFICVLFHFLFGRYQWMQLECSRRPVVGTLGTLAVDHLALPPDGAVMTLTKEPTSRWARR